MSGPPDRADRPPPREGSATAAQGTPVPVDTSIDREGRLAIVAFLVGPIVWAVHFFAVYLVAEAGCTGAGMGLRLLDPPVPRLFTIAATVVAAVTCLGCARWCAHRWRHRRGGASRGHGDGPGEGDIGAPLELAGLMLSLLSFVSVLMVGVPALWLSPC